MSLQPALTNEDLQTYLLKHQLSHIYQDVTESEIARKVDMDTQKEDYSGKKRLGGIPHTVKNAMICTENQYICYLSASYSGKLHDKLLSDQEQLYFPENTKMHVDLRYLGYQAPNLSVFVPHKKPYKSELIKEQK